MKIFKVLFFALATVLLAPSCSTDEKENKNKDVTAASNQISEKVLQQVFNPDDIMKIDLNQDLSGKSLQELRLLRNVLYARQGYCFMQADIRGYFSAHMKGYDSIMEARWWAEDEGDSVKFPKIKLTKEEEVFIKKIEALEADKKKNNYITRNGVQLGNVENIVNLFQFTNLSKDFISMLDRNNFAILPTDKIQLFHIYEENDYHQVPNFITTDLYLQLYHMYFSYLLKSLEENKFIPTITALSEGMNNEAMKIASTTKDERIKSAAEFSAVFYAIPYYILTGKKKTIPSGYNELFDQEIEHINSEADAQSEFLQYKNVIFPYSLFKPRGHYTRNEKLKKYFKTMMWLQTASFCRETPEQLTQSVFMAQLLNTGKISNNQPFMKLYNSVYEPIVFLIGEPDNLSVNDIVSYFNKNNVTTLSSSMEPSMISKVDTELKEIVKNRNKIKPKVQLSCPDKINFMPQRYLFDNEILKELVDVKPNAKRAYPKGLDVFAALGNKKAEDILLNEYKEKENWSEYPATLNKLKKKFENQTGWNKAVYNKWILGLYAMQKKQANYPFFMQTGMWEKKNLNTALASWSDLKHDAILYGEQPEAAECGGGGPPSPYTVGYVEPNISFWKNMIELIDLTEEVLKTNDLLTSDIDSKSKQLKENAQFLLSASEKELKKQKLSEQEYNTIETLGASTEYLTLSIVEPDKNLFTWENVQGPDRSVAVVADVYTRNINGCSENGVLHEGVGNVNEIYVVVEIDGYLYLTKGATFSYYEFVQPQNSRLTDEEWQKILESKKGLPEIPKWMKEIILPAKEVPAVDEKIFYSSGC